MAEPVIRSGCCHYKSSLDMKLHKISDNFYLEEFVPPYLIKRFGRQARWFVSDWQIKTAEAIRKKFGDKPMRINDWAFGGKLINRGTRLPNTSVGSFLSQHKSSRALDFNIKGSSSNKVNDLLIKDPEFCTENNITAIESKRFTKTWTHVDCRNTGLTTVLIVNPSKRAKS